MDAFIPSQIAIESFRRFIVSRRFFEPSNAGQKGRQER